MSPFTIYLIHHSHCDLGYTHDLPVVYELHRRFIDEALDLADRDADGGEEATFRWTCEVTSVVEHWMQTASPRQIERFMAAVRREQIEVCALWGNLTPLATQAQLLEMLTPLRRLRDEWGVPVKTAMNSDVNGFSWALAGLLASSGITGLTMSINEHFGGAPKPFPGLFRWRLPNGNLLPVWSGPTYAHTAWAGLGGPLETAYQGLNAVMAARFETDSAPAWLGMQITHPGPQNDNMGPVRYLSRWVRQFNEAYGDRIRLVITTPTRLFAAIAPETAAAEVREGEWNDWWNFGCASTPFETSLFRRATSRLEEADFLSLIEPPRNFASLRSRAFFAAAHYAEHTWGADSSVQHSEGEDARIQGRHKEQFAYDAFSLARLLRRDGLGALAGRIRTGWDGPGLMIFNPSPYARHEVIRVPRRFVAATNLPPTGAEIEGPRRWPRDQAYQHFVDRELFGGTPVDEIGPVHLPPFGWTVVKPDREAPAAANNLSVSGTKIGNGRIVLEWRPDRLGLSHLSVLGREYAATGAFGAVVAEEILGDRSQIMKFDESRMPAGKIPVWNERPPLRHTLAAEATASVTRGARFVDVVQTGKLPHADVHLRWRIFADHDDIEVEVTLRQAAEPRPHSYYLLLPFQFDQIRRRVATVGLVVDSDVETIPNGCRWWSTQDGFALGDEAASVYVATPDTPMIGFGRLPFGGDHPEISAAAGAGMSWVWLTNNYWETNFKADASGLLQLRFRLGFAEGNPNAGHLLRTGALARHPLAYHPLPEADGTSATLEEEGALLKLVSERVVLESCVAEPSTDTVRLVLTNPEPYPGEMCLRGESLRLARAERLDPEGRPCENLPIISGGVSLVVAPRSSTFLRLKASIA